MVVTSTTVDYDEAARGPEVPSISTTVSYDEAPEDARGPECVVCMEEHPAGQLIYFCSPSSSNEASDSSPSNASHGYCDSCFVEGIRAATKDRYPFRCCGKIFDINDYPGVSLSAEEKQEYDDMVVEINTPNPLYCSNPRCSSFIKPDMIQSDLAICLKCSANTCKHCRQPYHPKLVCSQDQDTLKVLALGKEKGWKTCPVCNYMVELVKGCHIIKCRCSWSFCYRCGATNKSSLDDSRHTWHTTCWRPTDHAYAVVGAAVYNRPPREEQPQRPRDRLDFMGRIQDRWHEAKAEAKAEARLRFQEPAREFERERKLERELELERRMARLERREMARELKLQRATEREVARLNNMTLSVEQNRNQPAIHNNNNNYNNNNHHHHNHHNHQARAMPQQNTQPRQPQQQPRQEPRNPPAYRGRGFLWMEALVSPTRPNPIQPENNSNNNNNNLRHRPARPQSEEVNQQPRKTCHNRDNRERGVLWQHLMVSPTRTRPISQP
ncbi:hypothetical protein QBC32DRAFT_373644 [Pseudoneurospora amorphoporcata]|uniref:RBR-type E3 ubiquitin transferase n=1 Tax=Pseudoneurospora amorphoporcata TaxID=241081 RepID=A0AAN6NM12_9PEZI|nr:hypothetical protein QBC32DRAFT_373644 [Pseudoneurospora amorphoporcata]